MLFCAVIEIDVNCELFLNGFCRIDVLTRPGQTVRNHKTASAGIGGSRSIVIQSRTLRIWHTVNVWHANWNLNVQIEFRSSCFKRRLAQSRHKLAESVTLKVHTLLTLVSLLHLFFDTCIFHLAMVPKFAILQSELTQVDFSIGVIFSVGFDRIWVVHPVERWTLIFQKADCCEWA